MKILRQNKKGTKLFIGNNEAVIFFNKNKTESLVPPDLMEALANKDLSEPLDEDTTQFLFNNQHYFQFMQAMQHIEGDIK